MGKCINISRPLLSVVRVHRDRTEMHIEFGLIFLAALNIFGIPRDRHPKSGQTLSLGGAWSIVLMCLMHNAIENPEPLRTL